MPGDAPARGDVYHMAFEPPIGEHYAVVVTNDAINANSTSVVVAIITTRHMDKVYPHQLRLPKEITGKPCKVKCDKLMMWPRDELTQQEFLGTLDDQLNQGLDVALEIALDLWRR